MLDWLTTPLMWVLGAIGAGIVMIFSYILKTESRMTKLEQETKDFKDIKECVHKIDRNQAVIIQQLKERNNAD